MFWSCIWRLLAPRSFDLPARLLWRNHRMMRLRVGASRVAGAGGSQVKTTAPKRFVVRPPQGHIMPGASQRITLTMVPKEAIELQRKYHAGQEEEAKDKFLVQTASLTGDFYEEHLQDRDTKLSSLSLSPEDSKTIKEEQTKIISEMWSQRPKTEIESKRLTTKFVYGSLPDSYSPSPIAPSVDPNMNAPSGPVPGSPEVGSPTPPRPPSLPPSLHPFPSSPCPQKLRPRPLSFALLWLAHALCL